MKLIDVEPQFVRYETRIDTWDVIEGDYETWRARGCPTKEVTGPKEYTIPVASFAEAQGIWFLCPKCFQENGGPVGTHQCDVTFEGRRVADGHGSHGSDGKPTRWNVSGTGFENLTTTPSILLIGGCGWHGYITDGAVS
jgi:uncharacterized protein DUF6527